ncbi:helix-turn-helix domain-containing protein [Patescibacteria group bacterium]
MARNAEFYNQVSRDLKAPYQMDLLLAALRQDEGQVFYYQEAVHSAWGSDQRGQVPVTVFNLNKRLEKTGDPRRVYTLTSGKTIGYALLPRLQPGSELEFPVVFPETEFLKVMSRERHPVRDLAIKRCCQAKVLKGQEERIAFTLDSQKRVFLCLLALEPGQVCQYGFLIRNLWPGEKGEKRLRQLLKTVAVRTRAKLAGWPLELGNVRGRGYYLEYR